MTGEKLESYEVPTPGILLTLGIVSAASCTLLA